MTDPTTTARENAEADARREIREALRKAIAGLLEPGDRIGYTHAFLVQSEESPVLWDLYVADSAGAETAKWRDAINVTTFQGVAHIERFLRQFVEGIETDSDPDGVELDKRGFQ